MDAIIVVVVVVAVLFGGTRIPKLARSLGTARSEFHKGLRSVPTDEPEVESEPSK